MPESAFACQVLGSSACTHAKQYLYSPLSAPVRLAGSQLSALSGVLAGQAPVTCIPVSTGSMKPCAGSAAGGSGPKRARARLEAAQARSWAAASGSPAGTESALLGRRRPCRVDAKPGPLPLGPCRLRCTATSASNHTPAGSGQKKSLYSIGLCNPRVDFSQEEDPMAKQGGSQRRKTVL